MMDVQAYINRLCLQILERFRPQKVILFGSYAYGIPNLDSDIDLLVVMPFKGRGHEQAVKIRRELGSEMPIDLLVRTPEQVQERVERSFMKPMTLEWIRVAEGDWATANRENKVEDDANYKAVSFHAQQCGEKYLKAVLQEQCVNPERTHNREVLLDKILTYRPEWSVLKESCIVLTDFAVNHRYPGTTTSEQDASDSLFHAGHIRKTVRDLFGLDT
jgi:HEPN domain-containing protein/predicted nucleotidyltransferase